MRQAPSQARDPKETVAIRAQKPQDRSERPGTADDTPLHSCAQPDRAHAFTGSCSGESQAGRILAMARKRKSKPPAAVSAWAREMNSRRKTRAAGPGRPRTDAPRCACGAMTQKLAELRYHKCSKA